MDPIRTTLKSTKRNVPLAESIQDVREREDYLERHSSQARNSEKIKRASNVKRFPEEKEEELPTKRVKNACRLVLPRHLVMKLGTHKGLACAWLMLS